MYAAGQNFEAAFESEWSKKPDFSIIKAPAKKSSGGGRKASISGSSSDSSDSDSDSDDDSDSSGDEQNIKLIQNQLNLLTAQLTALVNKKNMKGHKKEKKDKQKEKERRRREKKERKQRERDERAAREARQAREAMMDWDQPAKKSKDKKKKSSSGAPKRSSDGKPSSASSGGKKEITFEDKQFLTEQINNLNQDHLMTVLEIIQTNMPHLAVSNLLAELILNLVLILRLPEHRFRRNRARYRIA